MKRAFEMCDDDYVGTFALYGINDAKKVDAEAIGQKAREYVDWIKSFQVK